MAEPEEDDEDAKAKKEAESLKKQGGEAYKKRDFTTAADLYQKAWDLYPKDITFLTNLAGEPYPSLLNIPALISSHNSRSI